MKKFASLYAATFLLVFLISVPHVCSADKIPSWFVGSWFFETDYYLDAGNVKFRAEGRIVFNKPQWVDGKRCGGIGEYIYTGPFNSGDKSAKAFQYTWDFSKDPIWLDIKSDYPLGSTMRALVGAPFNDREIFPPDQAGLDWVDKVSKDYYRVDRWVNDFYDRKRNLAFGFQQEIYSVPVTADKFQNVRCVVRPPFTSGQFRGQWAFFMDWARMEDPTIKRWPKKPDTVYTIMVVTGDQPRPERPLDYKHPRTFRLRRSKAETGF